MILRRKAVTPTRKWEAVIEDSAPELDEAVEVSPPTVDAEEDVEDSVPELDEAVVGGFVVLDAPPIFWLSAKFLVADDYRLSPSYSVPFSKSDDVANERVEVQMHEHLFIDSDIGVVTGSITDNNKKYETNVKNTTKRLGEVDYTSGRTIKTITYSAMEITNININDIGEVTNIVKDTRLFSTVHFKSLVWKRLSLIADLNF